MKIFPLFLVVLLFSQPLFGNPVLKLGNIQFGGVRITPEDWPTDAFIDFSWSPLVDFQTFGFRADFGVTSVRHQFPDSSRERFLVTSYRAFAFTQIISLFGIEVGGGMQTWHSGHGGTHPIIGGNLLLRIAEDFFDRIYFGYSRFLQSGNPANEFHSGVAFNLF